MTYITHFEICALAFLVVVAVHFFSRRRFPSATNRFFGVFILIGLVDIAADIASAYTIQYAASIPLWVNYAVSMLLFYCQVALAPLMFLYLLSMTRSLRRDRAALITLSMVPIAVIIALITLNPLFKWIFYFDRDYSYHHGPLWLLMYGVTLMYLLLNIFWILRKRRTLRGIEYRTMLTFIAVVVGSIIFQYFFKWYLITGAALSLSICMMYLTL